MQDISSNCSMHALHVHSAPAAPMATTPASQGLAGHGTMSLTRCLTAALSHTCARHAASRAASRAAHMPAHACFLTWRVALRIVTSSSAADGWMPTVLSTCSLVTPALTATAKPCG
jgi:hypothetical protein